MNTIFLFLLKSILVSGILTGWYYLSLRNKRMHNYNRGFLLFTLLASVTVPSLHFQWFTVQQVKVQFIHSMPLLQAIGAPATETLQPEARITYVAPAWDIIVLYAIATVSLALLSILLYRVIKLQLTTRSYPYERIAGIKVIHTTLPEAPFSFFNYLFWKDTISLDSEAGKIIFRHELTHIQQRHTFDKLACSIFTCVCWFNPFYWLIKKELSTVHEFIADSNAIDDNNTDTFARMLLHSHNNGSYLLPEHRFFSSPVKRRLTMLQTNKYTSYSSLRRLAIIPLTAVALLLFSFTTTGENPIAVLSGSSNVAVVPSEKKIVLVVDAGHGGQDAGCARNGLVEKDLNLAIANRIKELSPQYNIEVHLTRNDDNYVILANRVAISNRIHPDYFISVHIGDNKHTSSASDNFELSIALDTTNARGIKSKQLGQMIYTHMSDAIYKGGYTASTNNWYNHINPYVCKDNRVPSILLDLGDIKNKSQMNFLTNTAQRDNLCHAILQGVVHTHKM
jgi:N-acetylmuramoyl-L-alanine amidase